MRINQLLYITEIEKKGSIANTAERLYISSSSISQAISRLEEELGVKIFERSRTGLEPTETGKKIIIKAQKALNYIEELKQEAKCKSPEIEGHLSISAVPGICRSILPKTLAELNAKFPKITLQIKETSPSQVRRDVLNGDADIGLTGSFSSTSKENQLLTTTHIIDSSMMICFRKDSELASKDTLNIEDLYKYPIATSFNISDSKKFHSQLFREFSKFDFLISQNFEIKKYFISEGLAIGFGTVLACKFDPFYQREDIIVKPVLGIEQKISYYYIKLKNIYFSAAGKEFLKELHIQANNFKE
ncbi:LysR family transcriptional regulator [Bacillus sp. JJ722]|uniref:LysR family transcriptional regulator n=1 Tax=Bacillus sp. JJ722 TaxID=3122973 RepID=UPI002FFD88D3